MVRDLLCKQKTQMNFYSNGIAALKLRGRETKTLIIAVAHKEEWRLSVPE
jgi:hypothetical protein